MPQELIFCPTCETETEHALVKAGQESLVRCEDCKTLHPHQEKRPRLTTVRVVVNKGSTSKAYQIKIPSEEMLSVGQEILVDDDVQDVVLGEITSLETERRLNESLAGEVKTIWVRAVDDVEVKFSVFRRGKTRSLRAVFPGDEQFSVGEERHLPGARFKVVKIKLRSDGFAKDACAMEVKRIWGREI